MDAAGASALRSGALAEFALAVPLTTAILYANGKALWGGGRGVKGRQTLQGVLFQTTTLLAGLALIGAFATLTGEERSGRLGDVDRCMDGCIRMDRFKKKKKEEKKTTPIHHTHAKQQINTTTGPRIPSPTPPTLPSLGTGLLHLLVAAVALPLDARLAWACHAANAALRRSPHTTTGTKVPPPTDHRRIHDSKSKIARAH